MKKFSYNQIIRTLLLFFAILIMSRASLFRSISPFGISFVFTLINAKFNFISVIISYFLSSFILNLNSLNIMTILFECSVLFLIVIIEKVRKKKLPTYLYSILLIISQSAYLYFNLGYLEIFVKALASIFVSFISFFIFDISIKAFLERGKVFKFTIDEKVCHSVFVISFFSGLAGLYIENFVVTNILCLMILFVISRVASSGFTICFSTLAGLGVSLYNVSIVPLALFSIWSTMMITFANNKKFVAAIMILASDIIMGVFLNAYAVYDLWAILSTSIGLIIVCLVPDKKLIKLSVIFGKQVDIAKEFASIRHEKIVNQKLKNIASVFYEMENVYKTLLIEDLDKKSAIEYISKQTMQKTCKNCEQYKHCFMGNIDMGSVFSSLCDMGISKGKLTFLDAPNVLNCECKRVQGVISNMNSEIANLNTINNENIQINKENMKIAEQLSAIGNLLENISKHFSSNINIDYNKSSDLYEELLYNNVAINDVVCVVGTFGIEYVALSVENSDALNPMIISSINKVLKINFKVEERVIANIAGYTILLLTPKNNFVTSCGIATMAKIKGENCGDSYAILKLDKNRYLYAISDGMGSGENAHNLSTATISLIENYYKAGFNSEVIIESVNNILLPDNKEKFSTLDSVIVDASSGRVDFVKIGASISLIKSDYESKIVECDSLPLGIIGHIKPNIKSYYIEDGDIIVLASDGVVDSFTSFENFKHFVNNERLTNVQLLAEIILEEANSRNNKHKDDMTVLTIKLSKSC